MPDIGGSSGASPTNGGKDLLVGEGSLTSFKKQLDKLVAELKRTPAAPEEIHASAVPATAYGDFPGARDLATHLARVQTRLELFAKIYGEQIEALGQMAGSLGIRRPLIGVLSGTVPEHDRLRQLSGLRQMMRQELRLGGHDARLRRGPRHPARRPRRAWSPRAS
jgi:hypothetical protein